MNFSKPLVVLAILGLSTPVLAEAKIKSTKSNASLKEAGPCTTPACCIQHPNANGCTGSLLKSQANLPRHPRDTGAQPPATVTPATGQRLGLGDNSERDNGIKGSKSNSYKEAEPTPAPAAGAKSIPAGYDLKKNVMAREAEPTPAPEKVKPICSPCPDEKTEKGKGKMPGYERTTAPAPLDSKNSAHATEKTTTMNNSVSHNLKEAEPTPGATPTPKSVTTTTVNNSRSNTFKEAEPTPAASTTTRGSTVKNTHSNTYKEAEPTPGVPPTPKSVTTTTVFNNSKSNSFREVEPTPGPTPKPAEALVKGSKSNTYKEAEPTPAPAAGAKAGYDLKKNVAVREAGPTPTPTPVPDKKSQGKEGSAERNKNLNSSRSN